MERQEMFKGTMNIKDEDETCERALRSLKEHAEAMGISLEKALEDVTPDTRKRLTAYMSRKAIGA